MERKVEKAAAAAVTDFFSPQPLPHLLQRRVGCCGGPANSRTQTPFKSLCVAEELDANQRRELDTFLQEGKRVCLKFSEIWSKPHSILLLNFKYLLSQRELLNKSRAMPHNRAINCNLKELRNCHIQRNMAIERWNRPRGESQTDCGDIDLSHMTTRKRRIVTERKGKMKPHSVSNVSPD